VSLHLVVHEPAVGGALPGGTVPGDFVPVDPFVVLVTVVHWSAELQVRPAQQGYAPPQELPDPAHGADGYTHWSAELQVRPAQQGYAPPQELPDPAHGADVAGLFVVVVTAFVVVVTVPPGGPQHVLLDPSTP